MTTYTSAMVNSWFNAIQFQNGVTTTVNQYVTLLNNGSLTQQAVINNIIQDSFTISTVNPVLRLYQASFNSIPDQGGQEFWTDQFATGAFTFQSMANFFANSAQFTATYGTTGASQQASSAVVTAMYYNILLRAPDAGGLAFWTQPGFTVGFVLANFASSVEFTNDSSVSFANFQNAQINALPVSDGGTGTPLPAPPYSVYNYPGFPVTTVALTTNIETLNIGDNTTVTGVVTGPLGVSDLNTLNAGDAINAPLGALNTTLSVTDTATGVTAVNGVTLSNVNTVRVTNLDATGTHTYNMSQATGLATVGTQSAIAGSGTTFSNLGNLVNGSIVQGAGTLTLGFNSSVVSGSSNAIGLTLNGAAATTGQTATLVADGIETINVNTTGAASGKTAGGTQTASVQITDADLKTLNITGNQSVVLGAAMSGAAATSSSTVATVNASGLTGNLDINLTGAGGAYISVTGGSGSDTIRVNALSTNSTIAGGAGTNDVLYVNSITTPSTAFTNVSGFEGIGFNGAVTTAQNLTNAGTISQVFYNNTASVAAALQGVASGVTVNYLLDNVANTNAIEVTNASAGTADVVNINLGSTSTSGQIRSGVVTASNIETLNIASNSQTGALLTNNGAQITDASVQTINVSGNQSFEFFGATGGSSLTTVNAGTSTANFSMGTATASVVTVSSDGATVTGGAGNDTLLGGTGNDSISGGNGNDILNAFNGNNTLIGGAGNDSIYGGAGNDSISGGDGSDRFIFDDTNSLTSGDTVSGGTGTNSIRVTGVVTLADSAFTNVSGVPTVQSNSAAGTTSIAVTLGANAAAAGVNTINSFFDTATSKYTGANALSVTATSSYTGAATINAGTGAHDDTIAFGGSSASFTYNVQDDRLTAGDTITGGTTVNDTINITASGSVVGSTLTNVTNVETVNILANGTDSSLGAKVTIGSDAVVVLGQSMAVNASALSNNSAAFTFDGSAETTTGANAGRFSVTGGAGNDSITGGSGNDTVNAGVGNDSVTAGAGNDSIDGGAGNNILIGGAGNDTITAGSGNDQLTGGANADSLTAGAGNDTFVYTTATDSTATDSSTQATLDTVDGFNAGDGTIAGVVDTISSATTVNSIGTVTIGTASLSTLATSLESNATLAAAAVGTAQVITISGGTAAGTYITVISGGDGYVATRDTLVKLTNASNLTNLTTSNFVVGSSTIWIPGVAFAVNANTGAFTSANTTYTTATAAVTAGVTTIQGTAAVVDEVTGTGNATALTFNFATGALSGAVNANANKLLYTSFDKFVGTNAGDTVTDGSGNETINLGTGSNTLTLSGGGTDAVEVAANGSLTATVSATTGTATITNKGTGTTSTTVSGTQTIVLDAEEAASGTDTLIMSRALTATDSFLADAGDTSTLVLNAAQGASAFTLLAAKFKAIDTITLGSTTGAYNLTVEAGVAPAKIQAATNAVLTGDVTIDASAVVVPINIDLSNGATYAGKATITVRGSDGTPAAIVTSVDTGDAADSVTVTKYVGGTDGTFNVTTRGGNDTVTITSQTTAIGADDLQINGGAGVNKLTLTQAVATTSDAGDIVDFNDITVSGAHAFSWTTANADFDTGGEAVTLAFAADDTANITLNAALSNGAAWGVTVNSATNASAYSIITDGTIAAADTVTIKFADNNGFNVTADTLKLGGGADSVTFNLNGKALDGTISTVNITGVETFSTVGTGAIGATTAVTFSTANGFTAIDLSSATSAQKIDISAVTAGTVTLGGSLGLGNTLNTGISAATGNLTVNLGSANAAIADLADTTNVVKIGTTGAAAATQAVTFGATTANFGAGDTFDFVNNVSQIVTTGTSQANQVILTTATDSVLLFDKDGSNGFSAGDTQITITAQSVSLAQLGIIGGDLVFLS